MGSPNTILARVAVDSGTRDSAQEQKKWEGVTDSSTERCTGAPHGQAPSVRRKERDVGSPNTILARVAVHSSVCDSALSEHYRWRKEGKTLPTVSGRVGTRPHLQRTVACGSTNTKETLHRNKQYESEAHLLL